MSTSSRNHYFCRSEYSQIFLSYFPFKQTFKASKPLIHHNFYMNRSLERSRDISDIGTRSIEPKPESLIDMLFATRSYFYYKEVHIFIKR